MTRLSECAWTPWWVLLNGNSYELHTRYAIAPDGTMYLCQLRVWADGKPRTNATGRDLIGAWLHLVMGLMGNLDPSALPLMCGPGYENGSTDPVPEAKS